MSTLLQAGKLISTTDMKLADKLQQLISLDDITHGEKPRQVQRDGKAISFVHAGEFYELAAA